MTNALTSNDFGETQSYEALITAVWYGDVPATDETDDFAENVFFSILVDTENGLVPIDRCQTVAPTPSNVRWAARPTDYVGKLVSVRRKGQFFYPRIEFNYATVECGTPAPAERSNPLSPGNEGDSVTPNTNGGGGCGQ